MMPAELQEYLTEMTRYIQDTRRRLDDMETQLGTLAAAAGASVFTGLDDTPSDYTGHGLKVPRVNAGEDALEFSVITPAMIEQIATQTLLGRNTADAGAVEVLSGLPDDIDALYARLGGRSGGQWLTGSTDSGGTLVLDSTSHTTKGTIYAVSPFHPGLDDTFDLGSGAERWRNLHVAQLIYAHGTIYGGTDSGDDLTLESTSHGTKGKVKSLDDFEVSGQVHAIDGGFESFQGFGRWFDAYVTNDTNSGIFRGRDSGGNAIFQIIAQDMNGAGAGNARLLSVGELYFDADRVGIGTEAPDGKVGSVSDSSSLPAGFFRSAAGSNARALECRSNANELIMLLQATDADDLVDLLYGTGGRVKRSTWGDFGVGAGSTLTIDVTLTGANRRPLITHLWVTLAVGGGSSNSALLNAVVAWQSATSTGNNGRIATSNNIVSSTNSGTITGPTAIANGFRYTFQNTGGNGWGTTHNSIVIETVGRGASAVNVDWSVS